MPVKEIIYEFMFFKLIATINSDDLSWKYVFHSQHSDCPFLKLR